MESLDARVDLALRDHVARSRLVNELMARLLGPQFLHKLESMPSNDSLSEEEKEAHRFSAALLQLGWRASPDVIRGTDRSPEGHAFLHKLAAAVKAKEVNSNTISTPPAKPITPTTYLPLIDFISSHFSNLVGEGSQVLPSDIIRASTSTLSSIDPSTSDSTKSFTAVDELLATSKDRALEASQAVATLRQRTASLVRSSHSLTSSSPLPPSSHHSASPLHPPSPSQLEGEDWSSEHSRLISSLTSFLSAADAFSSIYHKELGVWCESLPPAPPTSKDMYGERSLKALAALERCRSLLLDLAALRQAQEALSLSRPPLEGFDPRALERIASEASRRAVELERQAAILEKAASLDDLGHPLKIKDQDATPMNCN